MWYLRGMPNKHQPDGPELSVEQIEVEIDRMAREGHKTELWMSGRARRVLAEMEERDTRLKSAFEAGYRMGSESAFWAPILGMAIALAVITIAAFLTGNGFVLLNGWPD